MRQLQIIWARHGEAGQYSSGGDAERPLTVRGHEQAQNLARLLSNKEWLPTTIISSPARRTKETTQNLLDSWSHDPEVQWEGSFYLGNLHTVLPCIHDDKLADCDTLMLVGHNPGWSSATQQLCGTYVSLGTANAALLSIEAESWSEALRTTYTWTLEDVLQP